jgi:hypothetical protein
MDSMKQAGIPDTDGNRQNARAGLNRLERLAEDEVQTQAKLDDVDKQIKAVDDEQRSLLTPEPDSAKVDERLGALDRQQTEANEMHRTAENEIRTRPGVTDKMRDSGMADLTKKKEAADKAIKEERAGLEKIKAESKPLTPEEIAGQLESLDKTQIEADQLHKSKMQGLMETPGMEPDKLFEGMEKLKAEKAEVDKGISQKREGLQKAKEPKLTAGQKADKLGELHEKKAGLLKEKGGLQQKMQGIEGEKMNVMQSKGMTYENPKQGMGQGPKGPSQGGPKQKGPGIGGQMLDGLSTPGMGNEMGTGNSLMMGGFDLAEKALKNPNSTAATLAKEMQASGKTKLGPKQSQKVSKGVR